MADEKQQPLHKTRVGNISVAVFPNEYGQSIILSKGYRKNGTWENPSILLFKSNRSDELDYAIQALQEIKKELAKEPTTE